jgi:hypothetical protein
MVTGLGQGPANHKQSEAAKFATFQNATFSTSAFKAFKSFKSLTMRYKVSQDTESSEAPYQ